MLYKYLQPQRYVRRLKAMAASLARPITDYEAFGIFEGNEILAKLRGMGQVGGYIDAIERSGRAIETVPIIRSGPAHSSKNVRPRSASPVSLCPNPARLKAQVASSLAAVNKNGNTGNDKDGNPDVQPH